jgi:simple sugar transport system ATP-binding protein
MVGISKSFGRIQALKDVDFTVGYREVVGLLGDNGAGKSTLIKILCGVYPPDRGEIFLEGRRVSFSSPQQARALGIETVYQDLALIPLMSIARNFFLGREPTRRIGFLRLLDQRRMTQVTRQALEEIGISIRSPDEPVAILSGGERQSIAIGRAVHFGAKLLILDEPTSALSIKEAAKVLHYVRRAKERGLSVIFISHNLHHVYPVADRFVVIHHGVKVGDLRKEETSQEEIECLIVTGQRTGEFMLD